MKTDLSAVANRLSGRGMRVTAKLTVGERVHRKTTPNDLLRRKANQEELLAWIEKRPTKMVPKAAEELKNVFGKPAESFELKVLDVLQSAVKSAEDSMLLKDIKEITDIALVKDADINVRQFKRILVSALEERARRQKALQDILRIDDNDLSVKNLKKYLANTENMMHDKSNFYDIVERDIDELNIPKLSHKELMFDYKTDLPETITDMVRMYQEQINTSANMEKALSDLFSGVKYEVLLRDTRPVQTATEVGEFVNNVVHVMDMLTANSWEHEYTLASIRSMKEIVLVGFHVHESVALKKAMPKFRTLLSKVIGDE
jgi:hypothetical protein